MSLPSPTLSTPSLSADQIQFGTTNLLMGSATAFQLVSIEGCGKPQARSGNTARPRTRGAFVGLNLLKTRVITATFDIGPFGSNFGGYGNLAGAVSAFRKAMVTEGTTEYPLWIKLPNLPLVCCMCRVIQGADPKYDITADLGSLLRNIPVQFEATDPYLYSAPTQSTTIGLPTPGVGFAFPITFPWSFGGGSTANQATVVNNGDVPCWPVLVINGPCLNPTVSNLSVSGNPIVQINMQLYAGDQLVIDTDAQSIVYFPSGQSTGSAYPQVLNSGSTFFSLPPGNSVVAFNDQSTSQSSGTLTVWSASAYSGLLG